MFGWLKEFRDFAVRGNVIDLAVGVIIGAAFGALVTSMVNDVLMPPLGWVTGGLDFKDKQVTLLPKGKPHPITQKTFDKDVILSYGRFVNAAIQFIIQAFAIFMLVKLINKARKKMEKEPESKDAPPPPPDIALLIEIRDLLKQQQQQRMQ
jgi:large conductance mechanosensitive channel